MFNAPQIINDIREIKAIYDVNDSQYDSIDTSLNNINNNLYVDTYDIATIREWEDVLGIPQNDSYTIELRRDNIKSKLLRNDSLGLSYLRQQLDYICEGNYALNFNSDFTELSVELNDMRDSVVLNVNKILDSILPLNVFYEISNYNNTYSFLESKTHEYLSGLTYSQIKKEVI